MLLKPVLRLVHRGRGIAVQQGSAPLVFAVEPHVDVKPSQTPQEDEQGSRCREKNDRERDHQRDADEEACEQEDSEDSHKNGDDDRRDENGD